MLRTIKFRGKRIGTGEWVFGDLVSCSKKHAYIVTYFEKGEILPEEALTACKCVIYKVKVETVGEFLNVYKCFEGDLIEAYRRDDEDKEHRQVLEVSYLNGCFMIGTCTTHEFYRLYQQDFKIIGTIHDQKAEVSNE